MTRNLYRFSILRASTLILTTKVTINSKMYILIMNYDPTTMSFRSSSKYLSKTSRIIKANTRNSVPTMNHARITFII